MEHISDLATKLDLALKALTLSRVELSHRLAVDKSLVGRWLSGSVHPTEHNLTRVTALIAERLDGFRLADWFADLEHFAARLGVERAHPTPTVAALTSSGPLAAFLESAQPDLAHRAAAYEGFWRTARPSFLMRDRVFHEYGMVRRTPDGMVEIRMEGSGLGFDGWAFPIAGNLFVYLFDTTGRTPMTVLFRGVSLPKAMVLDGILLLAALDADRTPAAVPILLERVGDLSGDREADRARCTRMVEDMPDPVDPLPREELEARLFRDTGPQAAANGGEAFLAVTGARSHTRGVTAAGLSG